MKRLLAMAAALAALSSIASGYYHWIFFTTRNGPLVGIPVKFDINALPDRTVSYFISDQGPSPLMPGDTFESIVSQIRLAADIWNNVGTSQLRVKFGGISSTQTQDLSPGIDVVFDDNMPPGLLAQSRPSTVNEIATVAGGAAFVPIVRSRLQLRKDLTANQQASYSDSFFLTIVHEFGHTLGLQHSMTSAVMSTAITRATTKSKPLGVDDVAGISLLYPTAAFLTNTGTITGKVLLSGAAVNLASVVAISTGGAAVGAMTAPDGSYHIDGIPPGQYYVYTHPLPPAQLGEGSPANIVAPQDSSGRPLPANTGFDTQFFPGTRDWTQATQINVAAGNSSDGVNFNVQRRNGPAVYNMSTYGYPGAGLVAVPTPPVQPGRAYIAFYANGTVVNNNQVAPGLNVSVLGGTAQVEPGSLKYFDQGYLYMIVDANTVTADTPVALAATLNNDLYVLPAAFTVVPTAPPTITSVTVNADTSASGSATIAGANLGAGTRILFDGAQANILRVNSDGSLVVAAPPASGSYHATVEALSPDGQTSAQTLGSAAPPVFTYNSADYPAIRVNPSVVTAGTDAMVEIAGFNTNFADGQTVVGFGSADVVVKRVWVMTSGRLLLNVSVNAGAPATLTSVTVANGLQLATLTAALQIQAANAGQVSLRTPILNQATGLEGVPSGGTALINTTGLPANLNGWVLMISNQQAAFTVRDRGQIAAQVPFGLLIGPQVVKLVSPAGDAIAPVLMQLDAAPPAITTAINAASVLVDALHPVHPGDTVSLVVAGLADEFNNAPAAASVHINVAGVDHVASSVTSVAGQAGACIVQFVLASTVPVGTQQPVTVTLNTRVSATFFLNIR